MMKNFTLQTQKEAEEKEWRAGGAGARAEPEQAAHLVAQLPLLADPQAQFLILSRSVPPQPNYLLRCLPPSTVPE